MIFLSTILLILALVCFILAAFSISVPKVNLGWLGMAALTLAVLVGQHVIIPH